MIKLFMRWVLNLVISREEGLEFDPWKEIPFTYNEYGKPLLPYKFQFNQTSSNDLISIAIDFHGDPIGIDLSHSQQAVSSQGFMEQFQGIFGESEICQLMEIEDISQRYIVFNQFWTLKEAFTKLIGTGLNVDLSKFQFDLHKQHVEPGTEVNFQEIGEFTRLWKQSDVDYTDLNHPAVSQISKKPYCWSSIVINGQLPVILSVISLSADVPVNYTVNLLPFLAENAP
ncbi:hypothetical protein CLIB1444_04S06546 [[Candida] jaroonii]|uniref:Uncharacterized protein n=1 Tax=[Candida] jaroonii TaxID=467808 RepID=A0ACA9Y7N0_9ASCO|nr:hypothetical protein CLIB1444_04S06546 [[Candida] jaroonii]